MNPGNHEVLKNSEGDIKSGQDFYSMLGEPVDDRVTLPKAKNKME